MGPDGKDGDLPAESDRREKRPAKPQAARAQIEAEAAAKTRKHAEDSERRRQERASSSDEQAVINAGAKAAKTARPKPKAQANFTDPDPRIMKNSDGAYIQAYNAQAVVDQAHQVITAADVTTNTSDALNYTPMLDQSAANTGTHPKQAHVDAGYCSDTNLQAATDRQPARGTETSMATGRLSHDQQVPPTPPGHIPKDATLKERMARKLRTKPARAAYSRRKTIAEPVLGQIITCQMGHQLLPRGQQAPEPNGAHRPPATTSARSSATPDHPHSPRHSPNRPTQPPPRPLPAPTRPTTRSHEPDQTNKTDRGDKPTRPVVRY